MLDNKTVYRFWFLGAEGMVETSKAIVTTVGNDQILEVEVPNGGDFPERPYIVVGKRKDDGVYEGKHYGPKNDNPVSARWSQQDNMIFGIWTEGDTLYGFSGRQVSTLDYTDAEDPVA